MVDQYSQSFVLDVICGSLPICNLSIACQWPVGYFPVCFLGSCSSSLPICSFLISNVQRFSSVRVVLQYSIAFCSGLWLINL